MYLKKLTVLVSKSFADKTSLNLQPGAAAIAGPNGCGKSNVSDAIRWVLGKQSARVMPAPAQANCRPPSPNSRLPTANHQLSTPVTINYQVANHQRPQQIPGPRSGSPTGPGVRAMARLLLTSGRLDSFRAMISGRKRCFM